MKYFLILLIAISVSTQKSKFDKKSFFDFDQVEYYHVDYDIKKFKPIQEVKSKDEKRFYDILRFSSPKEVNEKGFIDDLNKYYSKKKIDKSKLNSIREIYTEKNHKDAVFYSCEPFYRDILIFKKSGKIIGVSKICFDCNLHQTIGSKRNTENLGQSGDFEKLKKILR